MDGHVAKEDLHKWAAGDPIAAFERAGLPPGVLRKQGQNWQCLCPFHADRDPSFTVFSDGGWKCFGCGKGGDVIRFYMAAHNLPEGEYSRACDELGAIVGVLPPVDTAYQGKRGAKLKKPSDLRPPDVVHHVRDADGSAVAEHHRWLDAAGKTEDTVWARPGGRRGLNGVSPSSLPLYCLPEALALPTGSRLVVTEGEKACDLLRAAGCNAVGTYGTSALPDDGCLTPLLPYTVTLWPDADDVGRKHMDAVGARLVGLGAAPLVISWPGPPKGDAEEFIAGGGDLEDLLSRAVPFVANENAFCDTSEQDADVPELVSPMSWTQAKQRGVEVRWAWESWLPRGYATVLAGDTGTWKTWIALAVAQPVVAGTQWPDQSAGPQPGLVFWLEAEGRLRINLKRAEGMGMDLDGFLGMPDPFRAYYLDDKADFANLSLIVRAVRPQLLVVDSWNRAYLGKEDSSEVRHTLDSVQHLIEEVDAACLLMQHVRKPTGFDDENGSKVHRVRGSSALCNVAVSVIGTEVVPGVERQGVLSVWKSNLAEEWPKPLGFTVRDGQVLFGEAPPMETSGTASRLAEAQEFLREVLAGGRQKVEDVKREAKSLGIANETLERARRLIADAKRDTGVPETVWYWVLK